MFIFQTETPGHGSGWAETPRTDRTGGADLIQDTPTPSASKRRSRWDETPSSQMGNQTPQTPSAMTPSSTMTPSGVTPTGAKAMAMATPTPGHIMAMTPEQLQAYRWEREIDERNRPLTDEELDAMFPPGYKILQPPAGYVPIRTPARKLTATPTPLGGVGAGIPGAGPGFFFQKEEPVKLADSQPKGNLPPLKPEDLQYFDKLLAEVDEELLSPEEQKERKIMKLLLKIKNGTPPMRIKIVQQIAILMGCAILPHLRALVEIIEHGLVDEQQKVRTITALALAALAEAATPYGIESFDSVLKPLWKGIRTHRGKGLAAFLKAIGYLIPLMDAEYANYYTREVMLILIREFQSPDEEMKKIVLKVVKQCCATDGSIYCLLKTFLLLQLVDTTVEIANKVGAAEIVNRVVDDLKDENEQYRKMVMETIEKILGNLGATDIDSRLEEQLIDGILYAYQEQTTEDMVMLNGFGTIVNALGKRVKAYLPQICGTILWRLNNKSAKVRQQAADLISRIAVVMKTCQEEKLMGHLGVVLYEYLGEEYPEVLGSILGALKGIVNVIGMHKMTPPIKDLLPRLTPILKNRHEKVQENCIDLVGRIADRGAEYVPAREWMRICFELLELLKAHKKAIRRATVNTFGYIAKAIGPHDVLATLLNNLRVQERQNRVCTTVAIAIVAETCSPFTVLPALMNEYRVPELNVQNGVLKSLSFLFEYIGEMGRDYIYAVTPLLEDALMDRDLVHRQTACAAIQHMSLGVYGFGCEDALVHLLNYVWPNIFETSPHLVQAFMGAVEGLRLALGPIKILQYCLQGLFHPARKVRDVYWKIYNSLYIGGQDALVAGYARVPDDGRNNYIRHELDYIL
ncbi:hypothetical protein HPB51_022185 [Rhipicephalus microplus]|uniref:Splicing factor 3b subunit 1 n=1 Tax=Rhipicephalus microplus TaxID=6941 RepID=A0A9J6F7R8_RHIMP|nr:hypothetical protein HPB51_022185 [Rhipicephalus microplus]